MEKGGSMDKDVRQKLILKKFVMVIVLLILFAICFEALRDTGVINVLKHLLDSYPSVDPCISILVTIIGTFIGVGIAAAMNR
ncbi:hypothetical protein [Faecalispora jeddahensis]|uniref:hypothetical protein n=1 Tax=Faecalispora jeddahensis TaxID=1414721 RepID=UPI0004BAE192|nr:hypothetical protein [Faecalispora jeddahensis]